MIPRIARLCARIRFHGNKAYWAGNNDRLRTLCARLDVIYEYTRRKLAH